MQEIGDEMMHTQADAPVAAPVSPARGLGGLVAQSLERGGIPIFLLILIVVFSTWSQTGSVFVTSANIQNIIANQSVVGIIAIGMVVPLVAGYFDLSVPAIAGLTSVTMASLISNHGQGVTVAILAGLLLSVAAGGLNGFLIAVLRLNPFIATLGLYILIGGLLQAYTKGVPILQGIPPGLGTWGSGHWLGLARPFWLLMLIAILVWFLLAQTPYGRTLAAIGSNEGAAKLAGIRVERAVLLTYVLSGLLGGLAGVMLTIRNGSADQSSAISYLFPAFAALFLGQTSIKPGYPNVWGTVFGVFLIAVAVNGLTLAGAQGWVSAVFNGTALLLSVTVSAVGARYRDRRATAAQYASVRDQPEAPSSPRSPAGIGALRDAGASSSGPSDPSKL